MRGEHSLGPRHRGVGYVGLEVQKQEGASASVEDLVGIHTASVVSPEPTLTFEALRSKPFEEG